MKDTDLSNNRLHQLFSLSGKVALVTGGARGVGGMIAKGLVEQGVKTYISSHIDKECQATAAELATLGECIAIPGDLDISTMAGIQQLAQAFGKREDKLHILVNAAGIRTSAPLETFSEAEWDNVVDLNAKTLFFLTQQLLASLKAAGSAEDPARIINIASIGGMISPVGDGYSYGASKAAVIHITRHLGARLGQSHITVNAISPGMFPTQMTAAALADEELMKRFIKKRVPRGRIGEPDDIAGTVIYLCSKAGAWVTGSNLVLDGGMVAAG